jgi:hypothetical protein
MKTLRYSIRALLFLTAGVAVLLAAALWLTKDYRERRAIERRLRLQGAVYARVDENRLSSAVFTQRLSSSDLKGLKSIHKLELQGFAVDAATLKKLRTLERIDSLMFQSCSLPDSAALAELQDLPLKELHFWSTPITDAAVDQLSTLTGVESMTFVNTQLTPNGIARLQAANPKLRVHARP